MMRLHRRSNAPVAPPRECRLLGKPCSRPPAVEWIVAGKSWIQMIQFEKDGNWELGETHIPRWYCTVHSPKTEETVETTLAALERAMWKSIGKL
jgi:hypothetical protein